MVAAEPKFEPTLCHGLVEAIAASLRAQADSQGVKLVVASNGEDIVARIDRKVLGTVVMDLVNHAIPGTRPSVAHLSVLRCVADGKMRLKSASRKLPGTSRPRLRRPGRAGPQA